MAITIDVTQAVTDGQFGELTITFRNDTTAAVNGATLYVSHNGVITPDAQGSLAYIPAKTDGGYAVPGPIAAGASVSRVFAVKPVDAEAGKTYDALVEATPQGGATQSAHQQMFVEARPEIYAAIGAAERLRQTLLNSYEDFKQTGRQVHQETALPETGGEPANEALQPSSFQWALSAIEFGTRLFQSQRGKTKVTP